MPRFNVTAKLPSGESQDFQREADSEARLLKDLRSEGLVPVRVEDSKQSSDFFGSLFQRDGVPKPRRKDVHAFMSNFATLLRSGMDLERCLKTLQREAREPLKSALVMLSQCIRQGDSLSEAMAKTNIFSPFHVRVVRAGEHSGNVHLAFARIASAIERESEVRGKIRNAIAYPAFLVVFGAISFSFILLFILPKFTGIYKEMGVELPLLTKIMLTSSSAFRANSIWLGPLLIFLAFICFKYLLRFRESLVLDRLRMKIPLMGSLIRDIEIAGFIRTIGLLLQSGLPVPQALHVSSQVADSAVFSQAALAIEGGVQRGEKISTEMRKLGLFSETILNLVAVGEESGSLEKLMLETSEEMEKKMDQTIKSLIAILEPLLILVVGVLIGLMVMATLLPIFSLSAGMGK
jgi:type IV pilus assembly protein PilC